MAKILAERYSLVFYCNVFLLSKLSDNCPDSWKEFEGFCYKFELEKERSFTQAVSTCRRMNADLLVINSKEENRFVEGQIASDNHVWLGMILHSGLDASWELLNGDEPSFNLIEDFRGIGSYSSYRFRGDEYCAILVRNRGWYGMECNEGMSGVAVCKRPFSE